MTGVPPLYHSQTGEEVPNEWYCEWHDPSEVDIHKVLNTLGLDGWWIFSVAGMDSDNEVQIVAFRPQRVAETPPVAVP